MRRPNSFEEDKVTIMGGGGGASAMAEAFTAYSENTKVSIIVAGADSGGSSGELASETGTVPVGDIRRNLAQVAFSDNVSRLINKRFGEKDGLDVLDDFNTELWQILLRDSRNVDPDQIKRMTLAAKNIGRVLQNGLAGHAYGNLVLTGLAVEEGMEEAIDLTSKAIGAKAKIIPVTLQPHDLFMFDGPETIVGEKYIDTHIIKNPDNVSVSISPEVSINETAREELESSPVIIVGPGSPWTSIAPVLLISGVTEAMHKQQQKGGQVVGVSNLVNNHHDTNNWCVASYANFIQSYMGKAMLNKFIYNENFESLPEEIAVRIDREKMQRLNTVQFIGASLVGEQVTPATNDPTVRSLYRHNHRVHELVAA